MTEHENIYAMVKAQIEYLKPDVVYFSHPVDFDHQFFKQLSYRPALIAGWRAANIPSGINWQDFDLMLSHLSACRNVFPKYGIKKSAHFFPGFPLFVAKRLRTEEKTTDVVLTGHWSDEHAKRNQYIIDLCRYALEHQNEITVDLFLAHGSSSPLPKEVAHFNRGPVWGIDMYRALARGRIVINAEINLAEQEAGNMRLFETTGVGSFLLTERHSNLNDNFVEGAEVAAFSSSSELIEQIRFYLKNPEKREKIERTGQITCHGKYSLTKRTEAFTQLISNELEVKKATLSTGKEFQNGSDGRSEPASPSDDIASAFNRIRDRVKSGDLDGALAMVQSVEASFPGLENLEYVRARIYLLSGTQDGRTLARLALERELGRYPQNVHARELLASLE